MRPGMTARSITVQRYFRSFPGMQLHPRESCCACTAVAANGVLQPVPRACIVSGMRHAARTGAARSLKAGTRMTRRRDFIVLASVAPLAWPALAWGHGKSPVVGFLHSGAAQVSSGVVDAFRQGLNETGFTDRNMKIEFRWAEDHNDRLPALAADLIHRDVDVIAANSVAAIAARAATATISIVFQSGVDPVASGLVASSAIPAAARRASASSARRWRSRSSRSCMS